MKSIFIIKFCSGEYENYREELIVAFENKIDAEKAEEKADKMIQSLLVDNDYMVHTEYLLKHLKQLFEDLFSIELQDENLKHFDWSGVFKVEEVKIYE